MKKGIVVEHRSRYTIVMDKHGVFHKAVPIKQIEIGMETFFHEKKSFWHQVCMLFKGSRWKIAPMALVCLLLLSPLYILVTEDQAYAVVSIDINPSLNVTIDENYRIIDVDPINDDAKQLMQSLNVENHTITSLTDEILDAIKQTGGELETGRPMLMAVSFYNGKADEQFEAQLNNHFQSLGYQVAIYEVPEALRTEAESEHVSMNELAAKTITAGSDSDDNVDTVDSEKDISASSIDEDEKQIIENYYNENKADTTETDDESTGTTQEKQTEVEDMDATAKQEEVVISVPESKSDEEEQEQKKQEEEQKDEKQLEKAKEKAQKQQEKAKEKAEKQQEKQEEKWRKQQEKEEKKRQQQTKKQSKKEKDFSEKENYFNNNKSDQWKKRNYWKEKQEDNKNKWQDRSESKKEKGYREKRNHFNYKEHHKQ
ncbi:anti-sigma-I factor RsgI family protein [Gracilibacillus salinarum]|uniref:RsgI N-terminal anti-sigma domain-containing protein n=1 Tax=Gracilibacillus salinarum TaxID=2932255 RepID=A0ABY4GQQ0_9BACI|nr:hypothetical protein [Gracilibacillus salinarum]UOQ86680.1 hypothetical protein MUN87_07270 [Gracilibacillus salinarum]